MKHFALVLIFIGYSFTLSAQSCDCEIKVVSSKYATVRGQLLKIAPEGIGMEDYEGNYFTFRAKDIIRIKVRKRGLTVATGLGTGTLFGLGIGVGISSLEEEGNSTGDMFKLTAILTASGAVIGTLVGTVAEITNTKYILRVKGDTERFKRLHNQLSPYVNRSAPTQHVN